MADLFKELKADRLLVARMRVGISREEACERLNRAPVVFPRWKISDLEEAEDEDFGGVEWSIADAENVARVYRVSVPYLCGHGALYLPPLKVANRRAAVKATKCQK